MAPKRRCVPPIVPNADGTGFVNTGRRRGGAAPARHRSPGPRAPVSPTSSSSSSVSAASTSSHSSQYAAPAATQVRGRQGRPSPQASSVAAGTVHEDLAKALRLSGRTELPKTAGQGEPAVPAPAESPRALPADCTRLSIEAQVSIDSSLSSGECRASPMLLHRTSARVGAVLCVVSPYMTAYLELRPLGKNTGAAARIFVNEDIAEVFGDSVVSAHPLPSTFGGVPSATLVSVKLVKLARSSSRTSGETEPHLVSPPASTVVQWQALVRKELHHRLVFSGQRCSIRVFSQLLVVEVVSLQTSGVGDSKDEDGKLSRFLESSAAFALFTDATRVDMIGQQDFSDETSAVLPSPSLSPSWRCLLVTGESGTGKTFWLTSFLREEAEARRRHVEQLRVEELAQGEGSETGSATVLREVFRRARCSAPSTVAIDDVHLICGSNSTSAGTRWAMALLAGTLAEELGDIETHKREIRVVATAPSVDSLNPTLTSSGLLTETVKTLQIPSSPLERAACLRESLAVYQQSTADRHSHLAVSDPCLMEVAAQSHGFSQRDLHRLAEMACAHGFKTRHAIGVSDDDLRAAAKVVRPSSLKRFEVSVPNVTWADIGGSEAAKTVLREVVEWSLGKQAWIFKEFQLSPPKGVLLYGPPGCSKTMLAKALANESRMNFISIKGPEVFSKWVGDSEKAVRDIFQRARAASPCVVFIDELDGLCGHRGRGGVSDRVISQFLTELDGLPSALSEKENALIFVAATNRPDSIDPAVLRPGRIDRRVYVGLPQLAERAAIAAIQLQRVPTAPDLTSDFIAERTDGYSGAEVVAVVKEAAFHAVTTDPQASCVAVHDIEAALTKILPRIDRADVEWYKQWPNQGTSHFSTRAS